MCFNHQLCRERYHHLVECESTVKAVASYHEKKHDTCLSTMEAHIDTFQNQLTHGLTNRSALVVNNSKLTDQVTKCKLEKNQLLQDLTEMKKTLSEQVREVTNDAEDYKYEVSQTKQQLKSCETNYDKCDKRLDVAQERIIEHDKIVNASRFVSCPRCSVCPVAMTQPAPQVPSIETLKELLTCPSPPPCAESITKTDLRKLIMRPNCPPCEHGDYPTIKQIKKALKQSECPPCTVTKFPPVKELEKVIKCPPVKCPDVNCPKCPRVCAEVAKNITVRFDKHIRLINQMADNLDTCKNIRNALVLNKRYIKRIFRNVTSSHSMCVENTFTFLKAVNESEAANHFLRNQLSDYLQLTRYVVLVTLINVLLICLLFKLQSVP